MSQLSIGALKRTKWALVALVFLLTQFIPIYTLNGIAWAANTIDVSKHQAQLKDGTTGTLLGYTTGSSNVTTYTELDSMNFRFDVTSDGAAEGQMQVEYTSYDTGCLFFDGSFILGTHDSSYDNVELISGILPMVSLVGASTDNGSDWIQKINVKFSAAGSATIYYNLKLSNNAGECSSGSPQHSRLANSSTPLVDDSFKNIGNQNIPIPAKEIIELPEITVEKYVNDGNGYVLEKTGKWSFKLDDGLLEETDTNGKVLFENVTPNGSHTITESSQSGYVLEKVEGSYCTIATAPLSATANVQSGTTSQDAVCKFYNKKQDDPTITIIKNVVNQYGKALSPSDFNVFIKDANGDYITGFPTAGNATGTPYSVGPGTFTVGEIEPTNGYTQTSLVCTGNATNISEPTVTLTYEQNVTCTITNTAIQPTIILNKVVEGETYGVRPDLNSFGLKIGDTPVDSGEIIGVDIEKPYTITENVNTPGYEFDRIYGTDCPENLGDTVTLNAGQSIECTIVNKAIAPVLTVVKRAVNDNGGTTFSEMFNLYVGATKYTNGSRTTATDGKTTETKYSVSAQSGTIYELSEDPVDGYAASSWSCTGTGNFIQGTEKLKPSIAVDLGESATCTITNDDEAPVLTLLKSLATEDLWGSKATLVDFTLKAENTDTTKYEGDLTGTADAIEGLTSGSTFQAGIYNLSEDSIYTEDVEFVSYGWYCTVNGFYTDEEVSSIDLLIGDVAECTIKNEFNPATVVVYKQVINDNNGEASAIDFRVKLNTDGTYQNFTSDNSIKDYTGKTTFNYLFANTEYAVIEDEVEGYKVTDNECSEAFTVANGATKTCFVTNDDIEPKLTLVKELGEEMNGGIDNPEDWELTATGPITISGMGYVTSDDTFKAGKYTLSEDGPNGYETEGWMCDGGLLLGNELTIGIAEEVECTIVNTAIAPTITIEKSIINNNGGTATVDDFNITLEGGSILEFNDGESIADKTVKYTVSQTVQANKDYTLSEIVEGTGYATEGWTCGEKTSSDVYINLKLALGEDITCTITNDDIPPKLTIVKNVVNDDGGTAKPDDFKLTVDGKIVTSGVANTFNANQVLVLNETQLDGYTFDKITGDAKCPALLGGTITLDVGEDITCTITNNDELGEVLSEVAPPPEVLANTGSAALGALIMGGSLIGLGISSRRLRSSKKYVL